MQGSLAARKHNSSCLQVFEAVQGVNLQERSPFSSLLWFTILRNTYYVNKSTTLHLKETVFIKLYELAEPADY